MITFRQQLSDYAPDEFESLVEVLITAQGSASFQDGLLEHFIDITAHPQGSDLIYHPESGTSESAKCIVQKVMTWRQDNGLA
ncbi:bacteriocin immunity protein [Pseudomonas wayambapalatensis]|uniref:bacteriocin immunity protein n=1 Tax=unclassified Pseudomonas TaxID=196821 RepID=UPI00164528BC|nr:bacteriocin immunity protein [Pseudomonas sp. RW3S2]MBC3418987.1 bacteriocin immunity protein [Pseudomonas sp. RW3S2]QXI44248.1 bacteriocin immunity protein [Pseudomonas wayambapalatensis]